MRTKHGFTSDQIAEVVVRTHTVASHHGNQNVESFLDAQMSIPYAVAVAAKYGEVGLDEFYEHNRTDVEVNRITRLTSVVADAACDADYPRLRPAIVTITLADGRKIETRIDQPYGEPSNPVTDEDMTAKFLRLAGPLLGDDAERVADELWEFASLDILTDIQSLLESRP
jgi:2-methylcitrate dehydratase PrpD